MATKPNILLIVIDQLRADCLFGALANHVAMPNIRALADEGVAFLNHHTVVSPCGPSRASLLSGQYAMNHGSVRNGTPMKAETPTLGPELQKAGYEPLLFGYTDTSQDPRHLPEGDVRLTSYEELAPGFTEVCRMRMESDVTAWEDHLADLGIDVPAYPETYRPAGDTPDAPAIYPAEASDTAFLTDRVLEDLADRDDGWCAVVTYVRPHPPLVAPAPYNTMYDSAKVPDAIPAGTDTHPFPQAARENLPIRGMVVGFPDLESTDENTRLMRSLYFGLCTEVDDHVGRILDWLRESGKMDDTVVLITADHGEMLGDFGMWGKNTYHDGAFHVPMVARVPGGVRGARVEQPTESIDVTPTILDFAGGSVPHSMDGSSLRPFLETGAADTWRDVSMSELNLGNPLKPTHFQNRLGLDLEAANLAVLRHGPHRLVQFAGEIPARVFNVSKGGEAVDLAEDPTIMPILLDLSRRMLCHRMQNAEGTFSRTMITEDGPKTAQ